MKQFYLIILICIFLLDCNQQYTGSPRQRRTHSIIERPKIWSNINKVVVIFLENTDFEDTVNRPFMKQLSQNGALLTSYYGITHPSQPNYIAFISGQTHGVDNNKNVSIKASHLGDLLKNADKTWKSYAEEYPGSCYLGAHSGKYYRKHEPFISFENIQSDPKRCSQIVNADQFQSDLQSQTLPHFSLYIPDIKNNGHDTGVEYADKWLSEFFSNINQNVLYNTTFIITFDEGGGSQNNRIATYFYGAGVKPGSTSDQDYDHYCLLRTIEDIFNLPNLGNYDQSASPIDDIWIRSSEESLVLF